jgi:threonine-phosphate decarboxylase
MHGGRIYEYAERSGRTPDEILDFSANINPLGPPESVIAAVHAAVKDIQHYPDTRQAGVKSVLTYRFQIEDIDAVFCGNGAAEVIDLTVRQLRPERVYVLEPAFLEYETAARRAGASVVHVPLPDDFSLTHVVDRVHPRPSHGDLVVLNNPHNPTGHCWGRREALEVLEELSARGVHALVDESFMDFRWDEDGLTLIPFVKHLKTVVVVRSATKMYAIPGLRFGFGVAHPDTVRRIEADRDHWSVNHLAQAAAAAAYQETEFVQRTWQWLKAEHEHIKGTWGALSAVRLFPPSVNYFLVHLDSNIDAERIVQGLEEKGIYVRRCDSFRCLDSHYLRMAIKSHMHNEYLWHAFMRLLNQLL